MNSSSSKSPLTNKKFQTCWKQWACLGIAVGAAISAALLTETTLSLAMWIQQQQPHGHEEQDPASSSMSSSLSTVPPFQWMGPFLLSTFGFSTFFKAMNAGWGYYPNGADANLYTWLLWFVLLPEPSFVKGKLRGRATWRHVWFKVLCPFVIKIVLLGILASILMMMREQRPMSYRLWHSNSFPFSIITTTIRMDLLLPPPPPPKWLVTVLNGTIHLWFLYLFASFCLDFSVLSNMVTMGRLYYEPGFDNPLLASRSLREAWGERWNRPVGLLLKRTVYLPVRQVWKWNRPMATLVTFFVSGLLHEYNFFIHNGQHYYTSQQPGYATIFFVGMGFLMMFEEWIWMTMANVVVPPGLQQWIQQRIHVPTIVISIVWTLVAAWPFEQYFIQSWIDAGVIDTVFDLFPTYHCQY